VVAVSTDVKNVNVGKDLYWEENNNYSEGRRECGTAEERKQQGILDTKT
jgi:hypothetical protein